MPTTIDLLTKALKQQSVSDWARTFNISPSAITNARTRGRLSPTLAGNLAIKMNEDAEQWTAIAAVEAEPEGPLKNTLMEKLKKQWHYS